MRCITEKDCIVTVLSRSAHSCFRQAVHRSRSFAFVSAAFGAGRDSLP